jgi:FkbM family methyltransferase
VGPGFTHLVSNTVVQFAGPGARLLVGLILAGVLSRYLGVVGFGEYALVFAYVATFGGIFTDWGFATICLREISQHPRDRGQLVAATASLQACVAAATYLVMAASLLLLHYPRAVTQAIAIYGLSLLLSPLDIVALPFQADLRLARLVPPSLMGTGLNFVLTLAAIRLGASLQVLVGLVLLSVTLQYAWVLRLSLRVLELRRRPHVAQWLPLLREAWPLGTATILSTVLQQGPLLALSLVSVHGVGLYSAGTRIPQQLLIIPLAIRATTFPLLSRSWLTDRDGFMRRVQRLMEASLLLSIPLVILAIGLAGPSMRLIFGASFAAAALPFSLLMAAFGLMFVGMLMGEALIAAGLQRVNLAVLAASLPVLVLMLLLLVPRGGATGAAVSVLVSYLALVGITVLALRRRLGPGIRLTFLPAAGLAAAAGGIILLAAQRLGELPAALAASLATIAVMAAFRPALLRELVSQKERVRSVLALLLLRHTALEAAFCRLCAWPALRKRFRLGGIAYGCMQALPEPTLRVARLRNYKLVVNIAEPLGVMAYFYRESGTIWPTAELIEPGDVCVDAGAAMGHYALLMATKVGPQGTVIAFEPEPQHVQMMRDSIALNQFKDIVRVEPRALWNRTTDRLTFYVSQNPHNSGTSSAINHGVYINEERSITVSAIRLADYLRANAIDRCRLLKIDVERAEGQVVEGFEEFLQAARIDFIVVELLIGGDADRRLRRHGYRGFLIDGAGCTLTDAQHLEPDRYGDFLFVSPRCMEGFLKRYASRLLPDAGVRAPLVAHG